MKSHNQDNIYDMSSLQKVIDTQRDPVKAQESNKTLTCKHCQTLFENTHDLKTHIRSTHPTFKPCQNFNGKTKGDQCTYGDDCNYNHVILKEHNDICWDCGKICTEKPDLMNHSCLLYTSPSPRDS